MPLPTRPTRRPRAAAARLVAAAALAALPLGLVAAPAAADPLDLPGGPLLARPGVHVLGAGAPHVVAQSWLVADLTTGNVLAAKNAHLRLRPASTLKTLTAVTLLPRLDKRRVFKASWGDAAAIGSRVGIVQGGTYTIDQLWYGLFLPSGNDAAHALARAAGGGAATVAAMNATARRLRAYDTHAVNPSGLDAPGQFTSAYDLALFSQAGLARADFRRYCSTVVADFPGKMPKKGHHRSTFKIYNQNALLYDGFPGAIGVKTGYTTLAGRTFVGAASRGGHTLVATLMAIGEPSEQAARTLLRWGFQHLHSARPVGTLAQPVVPAAVPADGELPAAQPDSLAAPAAVAAPAVTAAGRSLRVDWRLAAAAGCVVAAGVAALTTRGARRRSVPDQAG